MPRTADIVLVALALAACDAAPPTAKPQPAVDAGRAAVDAATVAYDSCIIDAAIAAARSDTPAASIVAEAERGCKEARQALVDSVRAFKHAADPSIEDAKLAAIVAASIEAIAPAIRERAAVAVIEAREGAADAT